MKVMQLRKVLEAAEQVYRGSGNAAAAHSLSELSSLFAGREAMTVASFATMIAKVSADKNASERT